MSEYQRRLNSLGGNMRAYQDEDLILQRVLAESLLTSQGGTGATAGDNLPQIQLSSLGSPGTGTNTTTTTTTATTTTTTADDLNQALELSKREEEERRRRELEEEEELKRVLELSLMEK